MTGTSTTIRVTVAQRDLLRGLAAGRSSSMSETFDAALESLRRDQFFRDMATAEASLQTNPDDWHDYVAERDEWLAPQLTPRA